MAIYLGTTQIADINVGNNNVQSLYRGDTLVFGKVAGPEPPQNGLYIDYRQSFYSSGSLLWNNSLSNGINGTFNALPLYVSDSSSVLLSGSVALSSTYISASEAHSDFTVVIYSKYFNMGDNSGVWLRGGSGTSLNGGMQKRFVAAGGNSFWIVKTDGLDTGLDEVSGSTYLSNNFVMDTTVGSGSSFIQYENEALAQTVAATTDRVDWASNGNTGSFEVDVNGYVKRILVYNRALTAQEVYDTYIVLAQSTN
jgi:hypothetical protein